MQKSGLLLALLVLASCAVFAQQELAPSTDDGPLNAKPLSATPDKDGVYQIGLGVTSPEIAKAAPAEYPPDAAETDVPHVVFVSAVIGVDGVAKNIQILNPRTSAYDDYAIAAIKRSQFQPGTLNGNPVPVWVWVHVRFFHLKPAIPMIRTAPKAGGLGAFEQDASAVENDPLNLRPGDTPPRTINNVNAEFSEEARRDRFEGVVIVSLVVNEEGLPTDLLVERAAGHGLDEKALEAVRQYRFKPAMRAGKSVAVRIRVEISFRLGQSYAGRWR